MEKLYCYTMNTESFNFTLSVSDNLVNIGEGEIEFVDAYDKHNSISIDFLDKILVTNDKHYLCLYHICESPEEFFEFCDNIDVFGWCRANFS